MFRLELVQEFHSALCVGSSLEDGAVVVLQRAEPVGDIRSVVVTDFGGNFEICAQESGTQFGYKLFTGIAFVTPGFAAKVALKPYESRLVAFACNELYQVSPSGAHRGVGFPLPPEGTGPGSSSATQSAARSKERLGSTP